VRIVSGATARMKVIDVQDVDQAELETRLAQLS
jgi:uncharacterized protein YggU (UPF0235/DUF167 family)